MEAAASDAASSYYSLLREHSWQVGEVIIWQATHLEEEGLDVQEEERVSE